MPIHDYFIDNGTGANVRADINAALSAIVSLNSNPTEPGTMYAYQLWADTTSNLLKIRNSGNSAWITLRQLDGDFSIVAVEDGLQATPSLTFTNDLNTGVFRSGADALAIVTGGQYAIACTSTQAVGIKTANPSTALHVAGNARVGADDVTDAHLQIGKGATGNRNSYIDIVGDTTYTDYGLRVIRNNTGANATSELKHRGTGALNFTTEEAAPIVFNTTNSPALTITSGGLVGIGTSTPTNTSKLEIQTSSTTAPGLWVQTGGTTSAYPIVDVRNGANLDVFAIKGDGTSYFQGKLGIGTTSPGVTLDLSAATAATRITSSTGTTPAYTQFTNAAGNAYVGIESSTGGGAAAGNAPYALHLSHQGAYPINFSTNNALRATIDSSGRLLVGTTSSFNGGLLCIGSGQGSNLPSGEYIKIAPSANRIEFLDSSSNSSDTGSISLHNTVYNNRSANIKLFHPEANTGGIAFETHDGTSLAERMKIDSTGMVTIGQGAWTPSTGYFQLTPKITSGTGSYYFYDDSTGLFPYPDNTQKLGNPAYRWTTVYATTALINTSDANTKQQIRTLSDAEKAVAQSIKGLIRAYKFNDSVAEKGDGARIHVGVIAQDVQAAFVAEGLDASKYSLFCSDTWYEVDGEARSEDEGFYTKDTPNAIQVSRLGIRYDELLAFVLAVL
jgi:hypothetical protein